MYKALIVDDDSIICAGLQKLIKWEEYGFIAEDYALTGLEALKMIKNERYDLIITDIRMPKMDGIEFIKALHQKGYSAKIIILSGYRDFEYAQTALELGVRKYILKPVNEKKLVETIMDIRNEIENDDKQKKTMDESKKLLKERVILDLLKEGEENDKAYKRSKDFGIELENKTFQVCVLEFTYKNEKVLNTYFIIKKALEELASNDVTGYCAQAGDSKIVVLICLNGKSVSANAGKADEVFRYLERYIGNTAIISVGNEVCAYNQIHESYRHANDVLESGIPNEHHGILYFDELETQDVLTAAVKYVKDHCCEKLSLQSIASKFFFNPAYLGRVFKSYTGLSFNNFLIECKIDQAVKLLESKKYKVGEIAEKVGYSDYDHFCRVFKLKKGCRPSEYKGQPK